MAGLQGLLNPSLSTRPRDSVYFPLQTAAEMIESRFGVNARLSGASHEAFWNLDFTALHELFITLDLFTNQNGHFPVGFVRDFVHYQNM